MIELRRSLRSPAVLAVLAIFAGALVVRVIDLGTRAMHHDESLHATFSWHYAEGRGYDHNPLMHGPLLFNITAATFKLLGDSEVTARLPFAILGALLVLTPLLLRRHLGDVGAVATALLLAVSPVLLYYSRFARNDVMAALWTVLLLVAVWRYREDGRDRWLLLVAGVLALSFATKETAYLVVALTLVYVNAVLTGALLDARGATGARRWREAALLFPTAWAIAALWRPLARWRARAGWDDRPREADLLVVLGTLTLPFVVAAVEIPFGDVQVGGLGSGAPHAETLGILVVMALSASVGLAWEPRRWLVLAAIAVAITIPLFTSWFTNADGFRSAFWGQLDYWVEQQDVRRGNQPGFYYLMMVPLYEFLSLVPALIGGVWLLWRGNRLARLLAWWLVATLVALSFAGEKMPWLNVHLAVPLAFLAGLALGRVLPPLGRALRDGRGGTGLIAASSAAAVVAVLALGLTLRTGLDVSFGHPDTPIEPLIYTQTAPQLRDLAPEVRAAALADGGHPVIVDTTASLTWPWAWYLRGLPDVRYLPPEQITEDGVPEDAVLIVSTSTLTSTSPLRARYTDVRPYVHRWWFPEGGYRRASFASLWDDLRSGDLIEDASGFVAHHEDPSVLGTLNGEVLFPSVLQARERAAP